MELKVFGKQNKTVAIAIAVLYMLLGILFAAFRAGMLTVLFTIIGALVVVAGIVSCIKKQWVMGFVEIFVGAILVVGGWLFTNYVVMVLGVVLAIKAIIDLVAAIKEKKASKIVGACLILVVAGLLVACPWIGPAIISIFFIVIGVLLIIAGGALLVAVLTNK